MANILVGLFLIIVAFQYSKFTVQANVQITPITLTPCEGSENLIHLEIKDAEKKGEKIIFGNITIPMLLDANSEFVWKLRWWNDGEWEKKPKIFKGKVFFYILKFGPRLWKKIRDAANPPIVNQCPVKAGTYSFKNLLFDSNSVYLPMAGKGRWSGEVTVNKDGKTICGVLVADMA